MDDRQSSGTEKAVRAASAVANIARGATIGGIYGAAAGAVKSFLPEIAKASVIVLLIVFLGPLLIFTALPNILFGFDSATAPDIVDFTASARELEASYQTIDGNVLVADPASVKRSNQEWPLSLVINEASGSTSAGGPFWIFSN